MTKLLGDHAAVAWHQHHAEAVVPVIAHNLAICLAVLPSRSMFGKSCMLEDLVWIQLGFRLPAVAVQQHHVDRKGRLPCVRSCGPDFLGFSKPSPCV